MSLTIRGLLELPYFQESARLMTSCVTDRKIEYVTVMEAPDFNTDSLSENGLILTTLSAHYQSLNSINRVVKALSMAHVSAIGIKLGRYVNSIDRSTVEIAQMYGVSILALSEKLLFRKAISEVLTFIANEQKAVTERVIQANRELYQALLQNCSMRELLTQLSSRLSCYMCCCDADGQKLAEAGSAAQGTGVVFNEKKIVEYLSEFNKNAECGYLSCEGAIVIPCRAQERVLGLCCVAADETQAEPILPLVESISNALSVKLLELNLKKQVDQENMTAIMDDILFSDHADEKTIIDRMKPLNFAPGSAYSFLVITVRRDSNVCIKNISLDIIKNSFCTHSISSVVFRRMEEYLALVTYAKDQTPESAAKKIGECREVASEYLGVDLVVGSSMIVSDLRKLGDCYNQAKMAMRLGMIFNPEASLFLYDKYFEFGLISRAVDTSESQAFFKRIINPIKDYDSQYKTELWNTLFVVFAHDTLEGASKYLFVHVSTLRYRLNKVFEITGYNYFEQKGKLMLYLAVIINICSNI